MEHEKYCAVNLVDGVQCQCIIIKIVRLETQEEIAKRIDSAIIEVAGDSAATMSQAARIARGQL